MNPIATFLFIVLIALAAGAGSVNPFFAAPFVLAALVVMLSLKMANAWQKFVVLRAGKLQGVKGPACSGSSR